MSATEQGAHIIERLIGEWETPFVEMEIFESADTLFIARLLDTFCQEHLGTPVAEFLFYESSQGAVTGVRLEDGRRVVLKVHKPGQSFTFLRSMQEVQHHLVASGYPCPRPVAGPQCLARGIAVVEELIDEGFYVDGHDPAIRRMMAEALAQLVQLTNGLVELPGLRATMQRHPVIDDLWEQPHNKLFDFVATARGAEWIDDIARQAQHTLNEHSHGEIVLGHRDWAVKHFRFKRGKVRVIYDWDSLACNYEAVLVGDAARGFPMTWHLPTRVSPTREELHAFVDEYQTARGKVFTRSERTLIAASVAFGLAHSARIEHSLNPQKTDWSEESYHSILARSGGGYF
ncbi:MAG TPA: phosphotransferase, partial [Ktedonobacteraceae bacterium]|nr:phosphotransferase [Ktedonobacteraceae bacterium]